MPKILSISLDENILLDNIKNIQIITNDGNIINCSLNQELPEKYYSISFNGLFMDKQKIHDIKK